MAVNKNKKQPSVAGQIAGAALRGAASGGGILSAPFKAAQTGINAGKNISRGIKTYNQSQQPKVKKAANPASVKKPVKPAPKPAVAPGKPKNPAPAKKPVMKKK